MSLACGGANPWTSPRKTARIDSLPERERGAYGTDHARGASQPDLVAQLIDRFDLAVPVAMVSLPCNPPCELGRQCAFCQQA